MPRNATASTPLSRQQEKTLEHLLAGSTVTAAAAAVGVDRTTLHRWLREDPAFLAAYNQGRRELREAAQARLLRLAARALETVEGAVAGGDVRASLKVLQGLGLLSGKLSAIGPDDPTDVEISLKEHAGDRSQRKVLAELTAFRSGAA